MARLLTKENIKYATNFFRERIKSNVLLLGERPAIHIALAALNSAKQRPHGRWEEYDCYKCNSDGEPVIKTATVLVCSVCGREERYREPYCHCGAKMDLEEDDG